MHQIFPLFWWYSQSLLYSFVRHCWALSELQLPARGTCFKNLFQIFLDLLWCLCVSNVHQHLIMHIGCKTVQDYSCCLFPNWKILVCWIWHYFVHSFNITPVSVSEKIFAHPIKLGCIGAPVELFHWKQASHSSFHFLFLIRSQPMLGFAYVEDSQPSRCDTMKKYVCRRVSERQKVHRRLFGNSAIKHREWWEREREDNKKVD